MKKIILVILIFLILTIILTFPLVFRMNSAIGGFFSTDEAYAALWNFWWIKYSWLKELPYRNMNMIAVPFGFTYKFSSGYPFFEFLNKGLIILTNNIFAYNFWILLSFLLSGLTMFYLVYYLTKDYPSAIFSGIIYAFCPYHFVRSWQHLTLSNIQWMPLFLLSLLIFFKKMNFKSVLLVLFSMFLVQSFEMHYTYFMVLIFLVYCVYVLFVKNMQFKDIKMLFILSFSLALLTILLILPTPTFDAALKMFFHSKELVPSVYGIKRPFEDLFLQSARPLSYILPSPMHPIFGRITKLFVGSSLYGKSYTEHVLFLGFVPMFLAFVAIKNYIKTRKEIRRHRNFESFFILLLITAWLFSQPPWWNVFGLRLYMPSFFIYKVMPMLRAYCRFGILVMLSISVLAGYGLKLILGRINKPFKKLIVFSLLAILVLFEFLNFPPFKVIDLSTTPEVYTWLKDKEGDFTVVEYPLDVNGANVFYMYYQTIHNKSLINGTTPGTFANTVAQKNTKLSELPTAAKLKFMGAKYAIVHINDYESSGSKEDLDELNRIRKNRGLKLVKEFDDALVYEIIAKPKEPKLEE